MQATAEKNGSSQKNPAKNNSILKTITHLNPCPMSEVITAVHLSMVTGGPCAGVIMGRLGEPPMFL